MEMEIEVLYNFVEKDPKLLMDHIQSVASGEVSFYPITLGLVYDRLIGSVFPKHTPSDPDPEKSPGNQDVTATSPSQVPGVASDITPSSTPNASSPTTPVTTPVPPFTWGSTE